MKITIGFKILLFSILAFMPITGIVLAMSMSSAPEYKDAPINTAWESNFAEGSSEYYLFSGSLEHTMTVIVESSNLQPGITVRLNAENETSLS